MPTLKSRLDSSRELRGLLDVYQISEAEVQSTAVQGYPISGDGHSASIDDNAIQPYNPNPDNAPQSVCDDSNPESASAEAETFSQMTDLLSSFEMMIGACGDQYGDILAATKDLKTKISGQLSAPSQPQPAEQRTGIAAAPVAADLRNPQGV